MSKYAIAGYCQITERGTRVYPPSDRPTPAERIAALIAALKELGVACGWVPDDDCVWHTDCGEAFVFDTGGPTDNKMKFCPYCGKPMKENKQEAK